MPRQPDISILILTKDKFELIDNCLQSLLLTANHPDIELILGDTGSTAAQVFKIYDKFAAQWKGDFSVLNLKYYHFSKNNNELARHAGGKYLLFLNNDTAAISSNWIDVLLSSFADHPEAAIIGAKLLFAHNGRIQHAGVEFIKQGPLRYLGYHPYRNRHPLMKEVCQPKYMPAVTGAFLSVSRHFFLQIGGFSERYNQEVQDVDLCMQAVRHGKKCLYQPEISFFHLENGSRSLGEENVHDRYIFQKEWRDVIHATFFEQRFQSELADQQAQSKKEKQPFLLISRPIARGDVLAAAALVSFHREQHPDSHITFTTAYPELVDSFPFIDRVLHTNDIDDFSYDRKIHLGYESPDWGKNPGTWLEEMGRSFFSADPSFDFKSLQRLLAENSFYYPPPRLSQTEQYAADFYCRHFSTTRNIAISTGAGWPEREWEPASWDHLVALLKEAGYTVVQIGGDRDYHAAGAQHLLNRSLQENFAILKNMSLFLTLDSYPLHIAIAARVPVLLLTCKTCAHTVYLPAHVHELRHSEAASTPLPACRFLGCRQKRGDGRENSCASPILKQLSAEMVLRQITSLAG